MRSLLLSRSIRINCNCSVVEIITSQNIASKIDEELAALQNKSKRCVIWGYSIEIDGSNFGLNLNAVNVISRFQYLKAPLFPAEKVSTGDFRLSNSLLYQGQMINGEPDGNGKVYDINTGFLIYEGGVKKGIYNGPGKLYQGKYLFEEGEFKDGVIQEGTRYNENGTIYSGSFTNNECIGQGRIVFPNGFYVSGYFVENTEMACEYTVPIPSAKATTSLAISSIPLDAQSHFSSQGVFITENHRYGYFFYFSGDVFVGEIVNDTPEDGVLFKYDVTRFIPMVVGRGSVKTRYTKPEMVIEEDYKYFQMVCCCLLELC